MKLYCCLLSALLSCLICSIYAKYEDNLHGPLIEPTTIEELSITNDTTTTTSEEPGTMTEIIKSEEPGTATETTTTQEPKTMIETITTEQGETTNQDPITMIQKMELIKSAEAGTMIEIPTTEEPVTTDTTTTDATTTDTTTTDTTTTDMTTIDTTTIDTTTTDTTTTDMTTIDTTTIDTTTTDTTTIDMTTVDTTITTSTVSPNNNPCITDPEPENLRIHPYIYKKSSDCSYLKTGTILVDAHHCRRYYVCNANRAIRLRCPSNEWYDRQKLKCRHRSLVRNCPSNRN